MTGDRAGNIWSLIEPLLGKVERPSRYMGGEWNSPVIEDGEVRVVLAYPDVYEIGTSNLGLAILQEVVNDIEGAVCERAYSVWVDMEREMRASGVPLFTIDTHRPVRDFDVFGISIPHELTYTNIVNLIDMAGLPLRSEDRTEGPLVIGGGCGVANPEPLAAFFDLFVLGEAEESLGSLVRLLLRGKEEGFTRERLLDEAARMPGIYRPYDYAVEYGPDGAIEAITGRSGAPDKVRKNLVDLDEWLYPRRPVVPFCEAVHDRVNVEIFRGCTRGCRFCQAGMIYRPVRERSADATVRLVEEASASTGYDEISLSSLSSTDYTLNKDVARRIPDVFGERPMALSLPSLRMDGFSVEIAGELNRGGGGLTFAPEAGTERLRRVINKPLDEADMVDALLCALRSGRKRVKLYFMIGLPTETDEDVEAIGELVFRLRGSVKSEGLAPPRFNVSVSTFVPKPHTPFQWVPQESLASIERKQNILKAILRGRGINLSWHDREMSTIESLLARGDRRLAGVVENAWAEGQRFDSWTEHFDYSRWTEACRNGRIDPSYYLYRERGENEVFPWDHIDFGLDRDFLYREYRMAVEGETSPDCREGECTGCGVCEGLNTETILKGTWG